MGIFIYVNFKSTIMKKYSILAFLFTCLLTVKGQENIQEKFVIPLTNPGSRGMLEIGQVNGDVIVKGYSGKEVIVTTMVTGNTDHDHGDESNVPAGMKRINANPVEISATEEQNVVTVETESWKRKINVEVQVPTNFDLELSTVHGIIEVDNVNGSIELSAVNGGINLTNISGSVISNTVNGGITVLFKSIKAGEPMSFVTLNGDVDVTLPASTKATTKIRSDQGEIFTDFDMALERSKPNVSKEEGVYEVSINSWVYGKINGGGPEYTFKNMHGNIIVRKGN